MKYMIIIYGNRELWDSYPAEERAREPDNPHGWLVTVASAG
ncbi:MAG TPA: hypothetical protein VFE14_00210 [Micromonosporaceae bacterium]|nr:hypothetical protein [Micromonosporaceae bacterium]